MNQVHVSLMAIAEKTAEDLELLTLIETHLIKRLSTKIVEQETYSNGCPKGAYAVHMTEIQDCYWRRRNWWSQYKELTQCQ